MSEALQKEVDALSRIADRPSLTALAYALRHPETWPSDFVWDYGDCASCAIGLTAELWPCLDLPDEQKAQETWIAHEMAMSHREARNIFFGLAPMKVQKRWFGKEKVPDFDAITADDVADAIEEYLATIPA